MQRREFMAVLSGAVTAASSPTLRATFAQQLSEEVMADITILNFDKDGALGASPRSLALKPQTSS
jgi:hypothetical protein